MLGLLFASLASDVWLVAYLAVAELLVLLSAWSAVALELYSRSTVLELAASRGKDVDRVELRLERAGSYEFSARLARFLGSAALVVGIAYIALFDHLAYVTSANEAGTAGPVETSFPWGALLAALGVTFLLNFVVNDVLVRLIATRRPNEFLLRALPFLEFLRVFTAPIRLPLVWISKLIFRTPLEEPVQSAREEVLESVEEGEREGSLTADEADMIESIMDLDTVTVEDVCTPRGEIAMVHADDRLDEAARELIEKGHRRAPVYGKDRDDVVGVVYSFDLLAQHLRGRGGRTVKEVMRSPFFVPEGKPLNDLLNEMRGRRVSLAVILNEFGGTSGVVTMEDVLEEIVGEIEDEHDRESPPPVTVHEGTLLVDGRTPIEEVNRALSIDLPVQEDFETVGGLVFHRMGKVPQAGDLVTVDGVDLTVTDADERTVKRLKVEVPATEGS